MGDILIDIKMTGPRTFSLALGGKVDSDNAVHLESHIESLLQKDAKMIVVDLSELEYISSRGIGIIFELFAKMRKKNGCLLLCNLQPQTPAPRRSSPD